MQLAQARIRRDNDAHVCMRAVRSTTKCPGDFDTYRFIHDRRVYVYVG